MFEPPYNHPTQLETLQAPFKFNWLEESNMRTSLPDPNILHDTESNAHRVEAHVPN